MMSRPLGNTGFTVSAIGLGTWQLGADWGNVNDTTAQDTLQAAVDSHVTFLDTADVYGDGLSEQRIATYRATHPHAPLVIATKMGRRVEQKPGNYTPTAFEEWNARSRANLGVESLDLVQLHCPPTPVLADPHTWETLRNMRERGHISHFGASVETCQQALTAMENGAETIQIIFNAFRLKPLERVLPEAAQRGVGIIVRVPLASGLLSGKYTEATSFPANDHRNYNRGGQAFDVGETFSGVPYEVGVAAARQFTDLCAHLVPGEYSPAQIALAWVLQHPAVSTVIPGARNPQQAQANAQAAHIGQLPDEFMTAVEDLYTRLIRPHVHDKW